MPLNYGKGTVVPQANKDYKLSVEESPLQGLNITKDLGKKKPIEKKNDQSCSNKEESKETDEESISAYCARVFFSVDNKELSGSLLKFEEESFNQNQSMVDQATAILRVLKASDKRFEHIDQIGNSGLLDKGGEEVSRDANGDDQSLYLPLDDDDILLDPAADNADDVNLPEMDSPDVSQESCAKNVGIDNEISVTAETEWEKIVEKIMAIGDKLNKEKNEDGSEDIPGSLLSGKMHHKELEENHNDGETS